MQTTTTIFDASRYNQSATLYWLVSLYTDAGSLFLISNRAGWVDVSATATQVYSLLEGTPRVESSVNIMTNRSAISDVTLKFDNRPFQLASVAPFGNTVRLSDLLGDNRFSTVEIRLAVGSMVTDIADALLIFKGMVATYPKYNRSSLTIRATDDFKKKEIKLPENSIESAFPDAPGDNLSQKLPLVFGTFSTSSSVDRGAGLAVGVAVDSATETKYVFSDHALDSVVQLYTKVSALPDIVDLTGAIETANDSGYGTAQLQQIAATWKTFRASVNLRPRDDYAGTYDAVPEGVTNFTNALDRKFDTYALVTLDSSGKIVFAWDDYDSGDFGENGNEIGWIITSGDITFVLSLDDNGSALDYTTAAPQAVVVNRQIDGSDEKQVEHTFTEKEIGDRSAITITTAARADSTGRTYKAIYAWHPRTPGELYMTGSIASVADAGGGEVTITTTSAHLLTTGQNVTITGTTDYNGSADVTVLTSTTFKITDTWVSSQTGTFASTTSSENLITLDEETYAWPLVWFLRFTKATAAIPKVRVYDVYMNYFFNLEKVENAFLACGGRAYGSWINSRSSNWTSGNEITSPTGIIESVLRDDLGYATADIDEASFIDAEDVEIAANVNLHSGNEKLPSDLFRELSEQSCFTSCRTAAGKFRLIALRYEPQFVDRVIPFSQLVDTPECSQEDNLINRLLVQSRFKQEFGIYSDYNEYNDTNSQATKDFGVWSYSARWANIYGRTREVVADWLVNATNGVWSQPHPIIAFETFGASNADIEIGDWISLEHKEGLDEKLLLQGATWQNKKLLILKVTQSVKSTKFISVYLNLPTKPNVASALGQGLNPTVSIY